MYKFKYPTEIYIEITNKCNYFCSHCISSSSEISTVEMPLWKIKELIDYMYDRQLYCLDISGGEPLLHPDFKEIIEYAYSKELDIGIASNGYLLTSEIINLLIRCKVSLRISYDGYDEETYSAIRGNNKFNIVKENIALAVNSGISISLVVVLHWKNVHNIFEYIKNAKDLNISKLRLMLFVPLGRGASSSLKMISINDWKNVIVNHKNWGKEYGVEIAVDSPLMAITENMICPCLVGKFCLVVKSDGNVIPCSLLNKSVGNIYIDNIDDIWKNKLFDELNDVSLLKEECTNCKYKTACAGGCRGLSYLLKGDYLCKDPFCWIQDQNK
jgi:radical SAM protein with 4Fe4S-binding SPASM domain